MTEEGSITELDRLRAENESLRRELEHEGGSGLRSDRTRTRWAIVLSVVAALLLTVAVPAVWLNRVVLDTDTWVRTVAPLAEEPAIQDAVSDAASEALIDAIDSRGLAEEYLPDVLDALAGPISQAVDDFIREQADALVRSEEFSEIWEETNRVGHASLVAAITGREGAVAVEAGRLSIDAELLAEMVKARLVESGLPLVDRIPTSRLSSEVVLYESSVLRQLSSLFNLMDRLAFVLPLLGLGLAASAFGVATDRRRIALWLGAALVLAGLLPLQAIYLGQFYVVNQLQSLAGVQDPAAQAIYSTVFRDLIAAERVLALAGLVVWAGAIVAGPSAWATSLRGMLKSGMRDASHGLELGAFGEWVAAHKAGLRNSAFVVAVIVLLALPAPRTIASVLWISGLVVLWLLLVEFFGSQNHTSGDA